VRKNIGDVLPRVTTYTVEVAERICELIADGNSLRSICRDENMPNRSTVLRWLEEQPEFASRYARARGAQADHEHDDMMRIEGGVLDGTIDPQAARVVLLSKQWRAAKLAPKKYGERIEQTISAPDGGPAFVVNVHTSK
jgi:hypothetical protein